MAVSTVGTTAAELWAADGGSPNVLEGVLIHNNHASNVLYYDVFRGGVNADGDTEVTTSNGVPIPAGTPQGVNLRNGDSIRVISDAAGTDVRFSVLRGA